MEIIDLVGDWWAWVVPGVSYFDLNDGWANVAKNKQVPIPPSVSDDLRQKIPWTIVEILPTPPEKGVPPWIHPGSDLPAENPTIPNSNTIQ